MQVVVGREHRVEDLPAFVHVAEIGAAVAPADPAGASGIDGPEVPLVARFLDRDRAVGSEEEAVPRRPGREHAVEKVDAVPYRLQDVLGRAYAHEVARLILGQEGRDL